MLGVGGGSRACQAQINFHDQSAKVKLFILELRHFCIISYEAARLPIFMKYLLPESDLTPGGVAQLDTST